MLVQLCSRELGSLYVTFRLARIRWRYFPHGKSKSKLLYDWRSVNQYVLQSGTPLGPMTKCYLFLLFCQKIALLFVLGLPLWGEYGSGICSVICQWSELGRTHNHTLLSHLRLLRSLSVASYDSQGLRWKYSYPPPHGETCLRCLSSFIALEWPEIHWLTLEVEVTLRLTVSQYVLASSTLVGLATRYYFLSECCCLKFAVLYLWGALSDERTGLQFAVQSLNGLSRSESITILYCLIRDSPTWRARFLYSYSPGTGWLSYTPGHWVPFTLSLTIRRAKVEVF
jgi:hypothetical protein